MSSGIRDKSLIQGNPYGAALPVDMGGQDKSIQVGGPHGLAFLNESGQLPADTLPASLTGGVVYKGTWDAALGNPPHLQPEKGWYYVVSIDGATNLDGINEWKVGDWAIFNGIQWQKVDNSESPAGLVDAPIDGAHYVRKDGAWVLLPSSTPALRIDVSKDVLFETSEDGLELRHNSNAGYTTAACSRARKTGKYYFEVSALAGASDVVVGVHKSSYSLPTQMGESNRSWSILSDGRKYHAGAATNYGIALADGDTLMVAIDFAAAKIWFGKNGAWYASGNPATGANPAFTNIASAAHPGASLNNVLSRVRFNLGASAFTHAPPAGFASWSTPE